MSNLSRDQFKATKVSDLKKLKDAEDKIVNSNKKNDNIEIVDGVNKIRIAPKFPQEKDFYILCSQHWCPLEGKDNDIKRMPVPNSKVHGGTEFDIFEEYVKYVKENLDPSSKEDQKKLSVLTDYKTGLQAQNFWKAYGWKLIKDAKPKLEFFEFKKSVRDELNSLSIVEDDEDPIEIDPFTDVEDGKPILLTYNSKAKKPADYYKLTLAKNAYPLTDEMFDELAKSKPLSEIFRNNYTLDHFEKACDGIRNFDIEEEIELFDTEEFQEIVTKVRAQYTKSSSSKTSKKSAKEDDEEEEEKPKTKGAKKVEQKKVTKPLKEEEEEEDDLEEEEEEEKPKSKTSKKAVVKEEEEEEEEEDNDEEEEEEKPKPKSKIEELREKLKSKKK